MQLKKQLLIVSVLGLFIVTLYFGRSLQPWKSLQRSQSLPPTTAFANGSNQSPSKNVNDYISETLEPHLLPNGFCGEPGLLLVIVIIRPDNYEARQAIRESWGQKRDKVSVYFLVGETSDNNYKINLRLQKENEKYNDIIQENFIDSYNNLTLKSINMLKLFHLYCAQSYTYLMKIDDDVFLNVENVLEMLKHRNSTKDLLVGALFTKPKPDRRPSSKWYLPYHVYPEEFFPDYLCGPAYLMSSDVAEKIYSCTLKTPLFHIEDVYITGICAKKVNVKPRLNPKITCLTKIGDICRQRDLYTIHHYKPDQMIKSYDILERHKCPPLGSKRKAG